MISLNIQIKLILFSFCFGMLFKFFELRLDKYLHHQKQFYAIINSFSLIFFFALLYFYNIEVIANGILHPYSLIMVVIGYYLYKPIETFLKKWYIKIGDFMKMTRQAKARLLFFSPFCIMAILVFAFKLGSYTKTIYDLENETNKLEKLYSDLQDEGDNLKAEITKLHDPEYIARYARENYDYSKEGEIIIKIADSQENINNIKKNQKDDRFVLIVISFIIIGMIFIYIIGKGNQIRNNNKKNKVKK